MTCAQADNLVQTGLDGRLSPAERTRLDAHLSHCDACRAAWDEYRRLGQTATDWARRPVFMDDPGDAFTAQVMAQIADRQAAVPRLSTWQVLVGVLLAVSTLTALSFWLGPLLPSHLPTLPTIGLPSPQAVVSTEGLWQAFGRFLQETQSVWDALTTPPAARPGWVWSALAITLGVNVLFIRRARQPAQETAAR